MKQLIANIQAALKTLPAFDNNTKATGQTKKTKASLNWFSRQLDTIKPDVKLTKNIINDKTSKSFKYKKPGYVYMFRYTPPDLKTMPFYDEFPVILTFGFGKNSVQGVNLHYLRCLPLGLLLAILLELIRSVASSEDSSKIKLPNLLKSRLFRKYIQVVSEEFHYGGIKSKIRHITPDEFVIMTLLPVEKIKKKSQKQACMQIRAMMRKPQ